MTEMSVIRIKKDGNFFAASNVPFNDESLSWEARGVMGYLLSKPDNWEVKFNDLVKKGPAGAHKVRRVLKELEEYRYLERERFQKDDGTFDWASTIYETPTISRKSIDGETISQLSAHGLSIYGKPRDITSTDLTSTELINTESNNGGGGENAGLNVFASYEHEIGVLTPSIADALKVLEADHTAQWVIAAMKVASANNKRSLSYFTAILNRWAVDGYGSELKAQKGNSRGSSSRETALDRISRRIENGEEI